MEIIPVSESDRPKSPFVVPSSPVVSGDGPPEQHSGYAVTVRRAFMQYSDVLAALTSGGQAKQTVLKDFNMSVQRGHIYGLLGASGCGKTTILRGIVGELRLTAGEIRVLGHEPRTPASGIPGSTVGYMPQELSLLEELTIMENLRYYGCLGGMTDKEIDAQADHLTNLLDLPNKNRLVTTLSGGQQRRVSFAIALLHSPPVLVLDEPTVGVDPLLRESIWEFLIKLAKNNGTTVLITTHYIEEASQADVVGLMRNGKLMAEDCPRTMVQLLQCRSLEGVLLKLCLHQSSREQSDLSTDLSLLPEVNTADVSSGPVAFVSKQVPSAKRIKALIWKNSLILYRHYVYASLLMFLPGLIAIIFCLAIGMPPTGLNVSVVNQEANCLSAGIVANNTLHHNSSLYCKRPDVFSCKILSLLENKEIFPLMRENEESAEEDVRRGRSWAAIKFHENFTTALLERASYSSRADVVDATIDRSTVQIALDDSNRVISFSIHNEIIHAIKKILSDFDDECHSIKHMKDLPLQFKPPVYGSLVGTFRENASPGMVLSVAYTFPMTGTMSALLPEKIQGTLERSLVTGVTMFEVIVAHFITQLGPVMLQLFCTFSALFGLFETYMAGSYGTALLVTVPVSISGMVLGFLLASYCSRITTASLIGTGIYFTFVFTSGTIWPIEGIPMFLRPLFRFLPLTAPTEALRHTFHRGWTIANRSIQLSLASSVTWCLVSGILLIAIWMHRRR